MHSEAWRFVNPVEFSHLRRKGETAALELLWNKMSLYTQ